MELWKDISQVISACSSNQLLDLFFRGPRNCRAELNYSLERVELGNDEFILDYFIFDLYNIRSNWLEILGLV